MDLIAMKNLSYIVGFVFRARSIGFAQSLQRGMRSFGRSLLDEHQMYHRVVMLDRVIDRRIAFDTYADGSADGALSLLIHLHSLFEPVLLYFASCVRAISHYSIGLFTARSSSALICITRSGSTFIALLDRLLDRSAARSSRMTAAK